MTTISYSQARQTLKTVLDETVRSRAPIRIQRQKGEGCVLLSESDYSSLEETAYLLRSPKNAQRLLEALGRQKQNLKTFSSVTDLEHEIAA